VYLPRVPAMAFPRVVKSRALEHAELVAGWKKLPATSRPIVLSPWARTSPVWFPDTFRDAVFTKHLASDVRFSSPTSGRGIRVIFTRWQYLNRHANVLREGNRERERERMLVRHREEMTKPRSAMCYAID
jgi:hypothetical protein